MMNPFTKRQPSPTEPSTNTAELINAVFNDAPIRGVPEELLTVAGRGGARARPGLGSLLATTAGKIVLCTAVAAASVGGVYATTNRVQVPGDTSEPVGDEVAPATAAPVVEETAPATAAPVVEGTAPATAAPVVEEGPQPESSPVEPVPAPSGLEGAEVAAEPDSRGCEWGQANAAEQREGSGPPVDPCARADDHDPADPHGDTGSGDTGSGNTGSGEEPESEPPAPPAPSGPPEDRGRPADAGSNGPNNGK